MVTSTSGDRGRGLGAHRSGEAERVGPFHATVDRAETAPACSTGMPEVGAGAAADHALGPVQRSRPTRCCDRHRRGAPWVPVLGGLASARTIDGRGALFLGEGGPDQGAVGVCLHGVEMLPCVSQGAAPLGREMTITAAEDNVIHELAGKPAVAGDRARDLRAVAGERALVAAGLLIGIVIDGGKPEYEQGDFLVRGVIGADPRRARSASARTCRAGQVMRLHARDARSAGEDLRAATACVHAAIGDGRRRARWCSPATAAGSSMFGVARPRRDDGRASSSSGAPGAGFFAAGEIGPVGGAKLPARVHGDGRGVPG